MNVLAELVGDSAGIQRLRKQLEQIVTHAATAPRLGRLFERAGRREEAREHLTTATAMYREMDMIYWLEKVSDG